MNSTICPAPFQQYRWLCKHDQTSLANRLFFNNSALLNMAGCSAEAKQGACVLQLRTYCEMLPMIFSTSVLANKEEEDRRAATLPSPIRKEVRRRLSNAIEASVWNDFTDTPGI